MPKAQTDMIRGTLDMLILRVVSLEPMHGWGISERIQQMSDDALQLGIVLGTIGVYGVVSYSVQRRSAEFGIRMALGAEPRLLLTTVIRQGMLPVALGVIGGTVVALLASRTLSGFLFEVQPTDPVSVLVAGGALLTAGMLAALVPAVRASTADPAAALRAG